MSKENQYKIETAQEDAHIIHLKHQVNVTFDGNYNYYLKSKFKKFLSRALLTLALAGES